MKAIHARHLRKSVKKDLKERLVFIGGLRQVGKTTAMKSEFFSRS